MTRWTKWCLLWALFVVIAFLGLDFADYFFWSVAYDADLSGSCIDVIVGSSYCRGEYWWSAWPRLLDVADDPNYRILVQNWNDGIISVLHGVILATAPFAVASLWRRSHHGAAWTVIAISTIYFMRLTHWFGLAAIAHIIMR